MLAGLLAAALGCARARQAPAAAPPIVLITLDGLRADMVEGLGGLPGLTPNLDRFLAQADVAGRAIAASTDPVAAGVSLLTGLLPTQHGSHRGAPAVAAERETSAEALAARGYRTAAFAGSGWLGAEHGHAAGFTEWQPLGPGRDAVRFLRELADEPVFVWVDLDLPAPPLRSYAALLPRLDALGERVAVDELPDRVGVVELEAALARSAPLPELQRRQWFALYALNVARADVRLGELLDALAASPAGERAVIAVVSARGEQVGDQAAGERSGGLRRRWLEVPLGLRLGAGLRAAGSRPDAGVLAVSRLHASLVEAGGGVPLPACAPSLARSSDGALSEGWGADGAHEVSWISAGRGGELEQVVWRGHTDVPLTDFDGAELEGWSWPGGGETPLPAQQVTELAAKLRRSFLLAVGDAAPEHSRALEESRPGPQR